VLRFQKEKSKPATTESKDDNKKGPRIVGKENFTVLKTDARRIGNSIAEKLQTPYIVWRLSSFWCYHI
jgi:hypothetical protein